VSEVHTHRWVAPLLNQKPASEPATERTPLVSANRIEAGDGNMVVRPRCPHFGPVVRSPWNASILKSHQFEIGRGKLVSKIALDTKDDSVGQWSADILLQRIIRRLPERLQIEVIE